MMKGNENETLFLTLTRPDKAPQVDVNPKISMFAETERKCEKEMRHTAQTCQL